MRIIFESQIMINTVTQIFLRWSLSDDSLLNSSLGVARRIFQHAQLLQSIAVFCLHQEGLLGCKNNTQFN